LAPLAAAASTAVGGISSPEKLDRMKTRRAELKNEMANLGKGIKKEAKKIQRVKKAAAGWSTEAIKACPAAPRLTHLSGPTPFVVVVVRCSPSPPALEMFRVFKPSCDPEQTIVRMFIIPSLEKALANILIIKRNREAEGEAAAASGR
jgi:hypothetical protein